MQPFSTFVIALAIVAVAGIPRGVAAQSSCQDLRALPATLGRTYDDRVTANSPCSDDGSRHYQIWQFSARRGDCIVAQASSRGGAFAPTLALTQHHPAERVLASATPDNGQAVIRADALPADDDYFVLVTSSPPDASYGPYRIGIRAC